MVRVKKKGWIRETWPRENCRDLVAHPNQKEAGGERELTGWRIQLPALTRWTFVGKVISLLFNLQ